MPRVFPILFLMIFSIQSYALDLDELHLFTDKKGNQITANLLEVAADKRTARIRREDGIEFSPEIVLFSLDDQQYIKDWMEAEKLASADKTKAPAFHLTLEADRKEASTEKHTKGSYTMESTPHFFEISVLNTSRETLEGAILEYVIVWEEEVRVHEDKDDGMWSYTYSRAEEGEKLVRKQQRVPLEDLRFNSDAKVETEHVMSDRVLASDGDLLREDQFWGVLVRVLDADGQILAQTSSGKSELSSYTWEQTLTIVSVDPEESEEE